MPPNDGSPPRRRPTGGPGQSGRPGGGGKGGPPRSSGRPGDARPPRRDDADGSRPGARGAGGGRPARPGGPSRGGASGSGGRPSAGSGRGRPGAGPPREEGPKTAGPKTWGSLGRRGAGRLSDGPVDNRNDVGGSGRDERPDPKNERVTWERVDESRPQQVRKEASGAVRRGRKVPPPPPQDLSPKERRGRAARKAGAGTGGAVARDELVSALGSARGGRANERLRDAAHAFERERFEESRTLLRPIAEQAPGAASVRELLGLTYYRLGRWSDAVRELEAFRSLTGTTEQHPVLADAYRALKRRREVEDLWDELRESSPSADLVTEGRIVMAGSLGDQGKLKEAIALLEKSQRAVKRPEVHTLRQGYALADLYERAGDIARARELFRWVLTYEPDFADAAERAGSLA